MGWVQYSVFLTEGPDKGLERWVQCDENNLEKIKGDIGKEKTSIETSFGKVVWLGGDNVSIISPTEDDANRVAGAYGFPKPFLGFKNNYFLNRYGDE